MTRINPISGNERTQSIKEAFQRHTEEFNARITNMKATLAHSPLAFDIYMQWYPLYAEVEKILGKRLAYLYAYSISYASDCPLCSTFFRKIIIDAGEKPEALELTPDEQKMLEFGSSISRNLGAIADNAYDEIATRFDQREMVILIAFAGQMIATNVFSNVTQTDIDEYLFDYLPPIKKT
ncbi:MAG TPA: hypothetical protein VGQ53_09135 [Chitinophagaceae bacterium]|jgi:hypothetical protein|nr:hypothetical protein [Chitinophagaceae bacterium]